MFCRFLFSTFEKHFAQQGSKKVREMQFPSFQYPFTQRQQFRKHNLLTFHDEFAQTCVTQNIIQQKKKYRKSAENIMVKRRKFRSLAFSPFSHGVFKRDVLSKVSSKYGVHW